MLCIPYVHARALRRLLERCVMYSKGRTMYVLLGSSENCACQVPESARTDSGGIIKLVLSSLMNENKINAVRHFTGLVDINRIAYIMRYNCINAVRHFTGLVDINRIAYIMRYNCINARNVALTRIVCIKTLPFWPFGRLAVCPCPLSLPLTRSYTDKKLPQEAVLLPFRNPFCGAATFRGVIRRRKMIGTPIGLGAYGGLQEAATPFPERLPLFQHVGIGCFGP
jgi:hypothetical protein